MKPIRHLISIVFLLCGLTALGSERGYDGKIWSVPISIMTQRNMF